MNNGSAARLGFACIMCLDSVSDIVQQVVIVNLMVKCFVAVVVAFLV